MLHSVKRMLLKLLFGHHVRYLLLGSSKRLRGFRALLDSFLTVVWIRMLHYISFGIRKPAIYFHKNQPEVVKQIQNNAAGLREFYFPSPLLPPPFGLFQTAFADLVRPERRNLQYERETFVMPDGGTIGLSWCIGTNPDTPRRDIPEDAPIMFVLPGLLGHDKSWYITPMLNAVASVNGPKAWRICVYLRRGCGLKLTTPEPQDFLDSIKPHEESDMSFVLNHVRQRYPKSKGLFGCGYSIGANYLAAYCGAHHKSHPFVACAGICCPFDVTNLSKSLVGTIVDYGLRQGKIAFADKNKEVLESDDRLDNEAIRNAPSYREMCNLYNRKLWAPEMTLDEYLDKSSCKDYIPSIRVPFLFVSSEDDPVAKSDFIAYDKIAESPYCVACVSHEGGHHAFLELFTHSIPFGDRAALDWFKHADEVLHRGGESVSKPAKINPRLEESVTADQILAQPS